MSTNFEYVENDMRRMHIGGRGILPQCIFYASRVVLCKFEGGFGLVFHSLNDFIE